MRQRSEHRRRRRLRIEASNELSSPEKRATDRGKVAEEKAFFAKPSGPGKKVEIRKLSFPAARLHVGSFLPLFFFSSESRVSQLDRETPCVVYVYIGSSLSYHTLLKDSGFNSY